MIPWETIQSLILVQGILGQASMRIRATMLSTPMEVCAGCRQKHHMNQSMTKNLASQAVERAFQKVVWRRKFKAFLITSTATFAVIFMFWSMSVEGFVSQSRIRLSIQNQARLPEHDFKNHVARQWAQQLSDGQLDEQLEALAANVELKDPVMNGKNFDRVRQSLAYEIVSDPDLQHLDIYLTYQGTGSQAELQLINQLSEKIATRVATIGAELEQGASRLIEEQLEVQDSQRDNIARVQRLVAKLDADITEVRSAATELTQLNPESIVRRPVENYEHNFDGQESWSAIGLDDRRPRVSLLRQKLNALTDKRKQLLENQGADASLAWIEIEIEEVRLQLHELDRLHDEVEPSRASSPAFQNVAHRTQQDSMERIKVAVDSIDVISLKSTVAQLQQDLESQQQLMSHRQHADGESTNAVFPVLVENVTHALAKPVGGLPRAATLLGFFLLSVVVGSVVSWGYSPLKEDRGFADLAEIEKKLKLPVISKLMRKSGDDIAEDLPLCNLVMEMARLALLVILLLVVFGLVFDPSVRELFVENPLCGVARIMWNVLGKQV